MKVYALVGGWRTCVRHAKVDPNDNLSAPNGGARYHFRVALYQNSVVRESAPGGEELYRGLRVVEDVNQKWPRVTASCACYITVARVCNTPCVPIGLATKSILRSRGCACSYALCTRLLQHYLCLLFKSYGVLSWSIGPGLWWRSGRS